MKRALMVASVASMIDLFNMSNIRTLQEMGYEVHVACNFETGSITSAARVAEFRQELIQLGCIVHQLPIPRTLDRVGDIWSSFRSLQELCKEMYFDIIHCHSPIGGIVTRLACRRTRKRGSRVIYTAHGFHFFRGAPFVNWLLYYLPEKWLSRWTDCLITINEEDYMLARHRRFRSAQIELVSGIGVDLDRFSPASALQRQELRERYGYSEDDFVAIYVGELSARKQQDLLIRAVAQVIDRIPQLRLLLVGLGSYQAAYADLIQELDLETTVTLLGYRRDIPALMRLSDVAASSSRQEGLAVNVMEAMATGLPVVVTNVRGNRDLVKDGLNGYVVEADNPSELGQRIFDLFSDPAKRLSFGNQSRLMARDYAVTRVQRQMASIYQSVTGDGA